jgi:hypothetical protein
LLTIWDNRKPKKWYNGCLKEAAGCGSIVPERGRSASTRIAASIHLLLRLIRNRRGCNGSSADGAESLEEGGTDAAMKWRKNNWRVGVAGGQLSGTYMTFANELAQVLDDGDNLRVIPIVTYGAASNLDDLLYLRYVSMSR